MQKPQYLPIDLGTANCQKNVKQSKSTEKIWQSKIGKLILIGYRVRMLPVSLASMGALDKVRLEW